MAKNNNLPDFLKDVADAIREKKGTSNLINPQDFSTEIEGIQTSNIDLSQTTATAEDVKEGKQFFNASGEKTTGTYKDMLQQRVDATNSCNYLFNQYSGNNLDFIKGLDTSRVTSMQSMFSNCSSLTSLDLSNFVTTNVTNMYNMFSYCSKLTSLDLSNFDTSKVKSMYAMFAQCSGLTSLDVSNFVTTNVTNMLYMFDSCRGLTSLDLSSWNTENLTEAQGVFQNCSSLISIDVSHINISKVKNINSFFSNCSTLTTLDLSSWDTSHIEQMQSLVNNCKNIETINGVIDMSSLTGPPYNMFINCKMLTSITLKNIKKTLEIGSGTSWGTLLTDNSIVNTFQELWDLTGSSTQTLTLSTPSLARTESIYVKLIDVTEEMRTQDEYIDNKKPCVVCESTDEGAMTLKEYGISKNWNIA